MSTKLNISIVVDSREEAEIATKAIGEAAKEFIMSIKASGSYASEIETNVDILVAPPTLKLEAAEPRSTPVGIDITATDPKVIISDKESG